jgi:hypothetical protein
MQAVLFSILRKTHRIISAALLLLLSFSCTKEINIEIPASTAKLVVEGHIEPGQPPIIFLSQSTGYFDKTDLNTFTNLLIKNATILFTAPNGSDTLDLVCSDQIPPSFQQQLAEMLGISVEALKSQNICAYTTLNPLLFGKENESYSIKIIYENEVYESTTKIPPHLALDKTWFALYGDEVEKGFISVDMSEPKGLGNCYRWMAMREGKDSRFIAPLGSAFEDKFIDGQTFNFFAARGMEPNSTKEDDKGADAGFYKTGDTVIIKFCTTDQASFQFYRTFETEAGNLGNPFASPGLIKGNISNGALGIWGGYGVWFDTVICKP